MQKWKHKFTEMRYSASCNNLRVSLDSLLIIDYKIFVYGQKKKGKKTNRKYEKKVK